MEGKGSKLQGQCFLERVGILTEVVYEEEFLQERLRPFSKNGCMFKRKVASKEKNNMNKQALCKTGVFSKRKGNYMKRTSKMGGSLSRKNAT